MSQPDRLKGLKSAARKIARARRIKHISALELVAQSLGYPHWHALTVAEKKGWEPSPAELATADALATVANPLISIDTAPEQAVGAESFRGKIEGHPYTVSTETDDVFMWGRGWQIMLPEAPSAPPQISVTDRRIKANSILEEPFRTAALAIAEQWRRRVHARIASDWPRRSTVPDGAGRAEHPLFSGVSDTWFCMHCDRSFTGRQMAENLFHCPHCRASPLDIHPSRWWDPN
ncbi:hypothetical protein [Mesorhizobium sp. M0217]|uniref:hypothetical protein n=1 Tax=unclassified Mesorhizobium TaxID=325217 RepID=UPI00333A1010